MTRIQGQGIKRVPKKWCSQLKAPFCCEVGPGGRDFFLVSFFLAPHATAEVRHPFDLKLGAVATLPAFDCHRKGPLLAAAVMRRRQRLRASAEPASRRPPRATSCPGPGAPAAPARSGALCAARRGPVGLSPCGPMRPMPTPCDPIPPHANPMLTPCQPHANPMRLHANPVLTPC